MNIEHIIYMHDCFFENLCSMFVCFVLYLCRDYYVDFEEFFCLTTFCAISVRDGLTFGSSPDVILCGWLDSEHQLTNWPCGCTCHWPTNLSQLLNGNHRKGGGEREKSIFLNNKKSVEEFSGRKRAWAWAISRKIDKIERATGVGRKTREDKDKTERATGVGR